MNIPYKYENLLCSYVSQACSEGIYWSGWAQLTVYGQTIITLEMEQGLYVHVFMPI